MAALLCKRENFQTFLDAGSETEAANALCGLLGIESRAELNGNKRAQTEFDELVKRYEDQNDPF
jgi:hypothetical protein